MTRKDYVKLAEVMRGTFPVKQGEDSGVWELCFTAEKTKWLEVRASLASTLAADNPRFDRARFIAATEA